MITRTRKALGVAAAIAATAASVAAASSAYADPPPPPVVPDPVGPGCDAFRASVPNWRELASQPVGTVLASIPEISTFNAAISGQLNPAVNVVAVLNNGPYVVFAPSNEAFAKLPPERMEELRTNPAALYDLDYYHAFLGLLGPDDVKGQRPTQQGAEINVTGSGSDIRVNDTAKVVCGNITAAKAVIYIIDQVLEVPGTPLRAAEAPPAEAAPTTPLPAEAPPDTPAPAEVAPASPTSEAPSPSPTPAQPA